MDRGLPMQLSASRFAKEAGVTLPTVNKWIKNGRISAKPNGSGGWLIDAAELDRIRSHVETVKGGLTSNGEGLETPKDNPANGVETLLELATLRERCAALSREVDSLKSERSNSEKLLTDQIDTLKSAIRLLEHHPEKSSAEAQNSRKGWLARLFG